MDQTPPPPPPEWVELARVADLPDGGAIEVERAGRAYALFRQEGEISVLAGRCPHQGGRMARGPVEGGAVTCPRRGCLRWRFDLATGRKLGGDGPGLARFEAWVVDGAILGDLPGP